MKTLGLVCILCTAATLQSQEIRLAGRTAQVHGFVSQGFLYSDKNNYLTMKTSEGSFAFTDGGLNISTAVTDKFRVGAQFYSRNIGELGDGRVSVDWAFGDYRFADWFGVRAGKVKTALGLYNDTQDMEFLHTWAMLPQSVYPLDLRASTIAHLGGDIYGDVSLRQFGSLSYTAYTGARPDDHRGGYRYGLAQAGIPIIGGINSWMTGVDVKWTAPLNGLMVGASFLDGNLSTNSQLADFGGMPVHVEAKKDHTLAAYAEFTRSKLRLAAELRRNTLALKLTTPAVPMPDSIAHPGGWYVAGSYRVAKRLELGSYHSRYLPERSVPHASPEQHIFDTAVTARVDLTSHWNVKVEGHFMDGYGDFMSVRGFYATSNPGGMHPKTNMLMIRTGYNF